MRILKMCFWMWPVVLAAAGTASAQVDFDLTTQTYGWMDGLTGNCVDVNKDGQLDLIAGERKPFCGCKVYLFLGQGGGAFSLSAAADVGEYALTFTMNDFNRDGHLDLVVGTSSDYEDACGCLEHIVLVPGTGDGGFYNPQTPLPLASNAEAIVTADFNEDGDPDVAVINDSYERTLSIFLGNGTGFENRRDYRFSDGSDGGVVGDFNKDGHADIAIHRAVLEGRGDGTFAEHRLYDLWADYVIAADLNGDDYLDLAGAYNKTVSVCLSDGRGTFGFKCTGYSLDPIHQIGAADLDRDGDNDLVALHPYSTSALINTGGGAFSWVGHYFPSVPKPLAALGDFDGDGWPDALGGPFLPYDGKRSTLGILWNRTGQLLGCKMGTVNKKSGTVTDTLFVNGWAGAGADRRVVIGQSQEFVVTMERPPSVPFGERAPFALYAWLGVPDKGTVRSLPFDLGYSCMPTPLSSGPPAPRVIWNNTGNRRLGTPTLPSEPAPSVVIGKPRGIGRAVTFFLQGIIFDLNSAASVPASGTNGIVVQSL